MCNREAASVEAAHKRWADKVEFVGVAWTGDDTSFQGFIDKYSLTFPQISDDPGTVFGRFGVTGQPALVIIDAEGNAQIQLGAVDPAAFDRLLTAATT